MKTGAILLIAGGAVLIYWVLRSGLSSEQSSSGSSSSSGDGSGGSHSSNSSSDSGSHSAIDITGTETGTVGQIYTVNSSYGDATDQQKDDMNAFAHASGW